MEETNPSFGCSVDRDVDLEREHAKGPNQNAAQHRIETTGMTKMLAICRSKKTSWLALVSVPQSNNKSCSESDDELASITASV